MTAVEAHTRHQNPHKPIRIRMTRGTNQVKAYNGIYFVQIFRDLPRSF
jgi:hypothetical protein